ncbi:MAG: glycosyl transferase [Chloroflexota bacterium]|nr:glycosyltransferase family 2 protein [Chloroflexota bacterium]NOG63391.1 glycosyltransferase family 2 protein [Chloroflexota bacterium]GIK62251.1 MAG: glycosyl transferase [Chloroflexota bacterium]
MTDLGVVIVNWNTRDLLRKCLQTVFASEGLTYQVVVVDNASTDGSPAMVRQEFPNATLITSATNDGFSRANNKGLRWLGLEKGKNDPTAPRYGLLLNSDTEVPPNALAEMVRYMDRPEHHKVGAAGCKLWLPENKLDLACRRSFPTPEVSFYRMMGLSKLFPHSKRFGRYNMTYLSPDVETEVDSVVGAFMMVRRETIAQVGLLDETYWMYGEDLDWAFRIKQAGWKIMYNPAVTVLHVKRASSRKSKRAKIAFTEAMVKFYQEHYRQTTPWWLHLLVMTGLTIKGGPAHWSARLHKPHPTATN